jgi:hypothetical protein
MKRNLNLFLGICLFSFQGFSQVPTHKEEQIPVAIPKGKNVIEIPSRFAKEVVEDQEILSLLANKEVKRVELYYTQFKENPDFDQQALNEKRVKELLEKYPQLNNQKIVWVWKEQTLAQSKEDASKCFHGFRIYGVDKPVAKNQVKEITNNQTKKENPVIATKSIYKNVAFEDKGNLPTKFTIDVMKGGDFTVPSGSVIHVPANAVVDKYGKPIKGNYTIEYTEYRNAAEIAFSGIPMHFSENGEEFQMNSAGMYKLNGQQNGKDLKLVKEVKIDFNLTENLPDLYYYALDKKTNEWTKVNQISSNNNSTSEIIYLPNIDLVNNTIIWNSTEFTFQEMEVHKTIFAKNGNVTVEFLPYQWQNYSDAKKRFKDDFSKLKFFESPGEYNLKCSTETYQKIESKIKEHNEILNKERIEKQKLISKNYLLISGLSAPNFGVYNCDQQKRIPNQISLQPSFFNKSSKSKIENLNTVNVIDRNLNASFSFGASNFVINKNGTTDLVFFDSEGKIYILESKDLKSTDLKNGKIDLYLTDVSDKVKTSDDLKQYLNL